MLASRGSGVKLIAETACKKLLKTSKLTNSGGIFNIASVDQACMNKGPR
jgi:hypothetical protein